jgi:hypothetical protein
VLPAVFNAASSVSTATHLLRCSKSIDVLAVSINLRNGNSCTARDAVWFGKISRDNNEKLVSYVWGWPTVRTGETGSCGGVSGGLIYFAAWQEAQINSLGVENPRHTRARIGRMNELLCRATRGPTWLRPDFRPNWPFLPQKDLPLNPCSMPYPQRREPFGQSISC